MAAALEDCCEGRNDNPKCETDDKRPQFGNRLLTDTRNVFEHNAWDNVVWDEEQEIEAKKTTAEQLKDLVPEDKQKEYEENADQFWDKFYTIHQNRFFKDRHWLFTEFPELTPEGSTVPGPACANTQNTTMQNNEGEQFPELAPEGSTVPACSNTRDTALQNKESDQGTSLPCSLSGDKQNMKSQKDLVKDVDSVLNCVNSENLVQTSDVNQHHTSQSAYNISKSSVESFPGSNARFRIFEVGCGVGNTVFPVLQTNNDPDLMLYCCDLSETAVQLVKDHPDYAGGRCHAFVCDVTDTSSHMPFPENSLDIIILIFILSAVHPEKMQATVNRLSTYLKPGGTILFRDYGRYDLAQLRFKKGKCLSENFYVRGDGTRVYFFTQDELKNMFTMAGLEEKQNIIDRRLQVNRGRQLKMYRVWIQCKYSKPLDGS